jgi:hypothetical protein
MEHMHNAIPNIIPSTKTVNEKNGWPLSPHATSIDHMMPVRSHGVQMEIVSDGHQHVS